MSNYFGSREDRDEANIESTQRRDTCLTTATWESWNIIEDRSAIARGDLNHLLGDPYRAGRTDEQSANVNEDEDSKEQPSSNKDTQDDHIIVTLTQLREIHEHAIRLMRSHAKLSSTREQTLLVRGQAGYQREVCKAKEFHVCESEDALIKALVDSNEDGVELRNSEREQLRKQLHSDRHNFRHESDMRENLENQLSQLERRMQGFEGDIGSAAQGLVECLEHLGLPAVENVLSSDGNEISKDVLASPEPLNEDTDPLSARYYDALEEVSFVRQHLTQIDAEHREARVSRNLREDQGHPADTPEEIFESTYQEEYQLAAADLVAALETAKSIEIMCLEKGLELEGHPGYFTDRNFSINVESVDVETPNPTSATPYPALGDGEWGSASPLPPHERATFLGLHGPTSALSPIDRGSPTLFQRVENWRLTAEPPLTDQSIYLGTHGIMDHNPSTFSMLSMDSARRRKTFSSPERSCVDSVLNDYKIGGTGSMHSTGFSSLRGSLSMSELASRSTPNDAGRKFSVMSS